MKLAEHFDLSGAMDYVPSWNIAPSSRICSITADELDHRHVRLMHWGLMPSWAKNDSIGNKLINARGETAAEKPSFRSAFKSCRCLIPESVFFEWKIEKGVKNPWYITLRSGDPMAFAGLWETWKPKDGEAVESCCIITTDANELMKPIHDRMPVILEQGQWEPWLSPLEKQADRLLPLVRPPEPGAMQAWPVTRELNRADLRNDAGLTDPIKTQEMISLTTERTFSSMFQTFFLFVDSHEHRFTAHFHPDS